MHDDIYQMYLEEIKNIPECTPQEEVLLLEKIAGGDETAKSRLVEGSLSYITELSKEYAGKGLPMGDLIQEANIALIMAINSYSGGDFKQQVAREVQAALAAALEEQQMENRVEEEMAARVNVLQEISKQMAEELGREATVEELADKMKMTVEEIKDIMKLTLDAISINVEEDK